MDVVITSWALNSLLDLKKQRVFTDQEYWKELRPDALLLNNYPNNTKFNNDKFWSSTKDGKGNPIRHGYKMKWHQIGTGKVQLRLPVGLFKQAFLCEAYVKSNEKIEKRKLAKFKAHLQMIQSGNYTKCGVLR